MLWVASEPVTPVSVTGPTLRTAAMGFRDG